MIGCYLFFPDYDYKELEKSRGLLKGELRNPDSFEEVDRRYRIKIVARESMEVI
jgi:hypothetical protein